MALERSMGLGNLIFYGTGTILGAGIFVVIGEVMGKAGALAPIAYAAAGLVAVFTALSFAEIAARVPTAGGAIDYTEKAFGSSALAAAVGWMLIVANIVSGATITTGFVSYLNSFVNVPQWVATTGLVALLGIISIAGMKQSAWFMTLTTLVGIGTLVLMLWLLRDSLLGWPEAFAQGEGIGNAGAASGILAGAFLAIYSFIGFGDVAQTAEEVKDVKTTLPRAMWVVLIIVFIFYIAVSAALGGRSDIDEIASADAPLVYAATQDSGFPALPLAIASLFVIVNGALTQVIAASRLLLDMGRDGRSSMPEWVGRVNETTNTPIIATLIAVGVVLALALFVPLGTLASGTSLAILLVFIAVNAALWKLKREDQPDDVPNMWMIVPILGVVFCTLTVIGQIALWITGIGQSS
ncbi:APC family permease [Erythrobacter sp.]|jgi:amino acid transporter|uniref:APC family permease n=1 Tax=Erythrobacter sp. TaxID=1042 RepID=UPI002EB5849D|nr:amino acid permease [Erythrobacter sp.]